MAGMPEYCPVSMGADVVAERWNLLIIRELLTGAQRFNDIHRGLPGLSRTLLSQRLRMLQRCGLVESLPTGGDSSCAGYRLTEGGSDLRAVLEALGTWAVRWRFPEPGDDQLNPQLLLWRMRCGVAQERLPARRVVIEIGFEADRSERGWLILDGDDSSLCTRDPMFDVDVYANASSRVWHEIWYGHRSLRESIGNREVLLSGDEDLVADFADWFLRSRFAGEVEAQRSAESAASGCGAGVVVTVSEQTTRSGQGTPP
jgi:DNA-binding HxlR family transcriptional regulator